MGLRERPGEDPATLGRVELLDVRAELVAIATAAATLPCTCGRSSSCSSGLRGPPCLACRAGAEVEDLTARGIRLKRWRNTAPAPRPVVHVAGEIQIVRTPRPGCPRYISDRWQSCETCGRELVHGRWALFYDVGGLVAVRESRSGPGGAGLTYPATGSPEEDPCWTVRQNRTETEAPKSHELRSRGGRMPNMKFAAYLRVSTEQQADEGLGLEIQEADIRAWAKAHKHRIVAVCTDAGRSGADSLADRPGLAEALARTGPGGDAQGIVVQRLDRLARDVVIQETFLAEMRRRGAQFHSTSATEDAHLEDDPDDPTRALVRRILGSIATYEREMVRVRLTAGMKAKAARGGFVGGQPPYGWHSVNGELAKEPAEQLVLRRMLAAHRRGQNFIEIAAALNEAGLETRTGATWYPTVVRRIIRRHIPKAPKGGVPTETVSAA